MPLAHEKPPLQHPCHPPVSRLLVELGGTIDLTFPSDGACCKIEIPLQRGAQRQREDALRRVSLMGHERDFRDQRQVRSTCDSGKITAAQRIDVEGQLATPILHAQQALLNRANLQRDYREVRTGSSVREAKACLLANERSTELNASGFIC
jgi:hypothetical protein